MTDGEIEASELTLRAERDYVTYASSFARVPGVTLIDDGELLARRGVPAHDYLNLVLGTWASDETVDEVIDRAVEQVGGPGRPFTWTVWPSNRPSTLPARLIERGFAHLDDGPLMTLELQPEPQPEALPDGLTIERVTDGAILREAAEATMPPGAGQDEARPLFHLAYEALILGSEAPMRYFAGRLDGRIVATSALYTGTGLAGIYAVGTAPDVRGRGYGHALTAAAIDEGRRLGYRTAALLSSAMGLPVYRRLGFAPVGTVGFYASPS